MILDMFENNVFLYIILGIGALGVLLKLIVTIKYITLIKASKKMGTSKNKLMRLLRLKFETCYKLNIGVNNVDSFVDKYVYRYKFCGILLCTWNRLCGVIAMLSGLSAAVLAVLAVVYDCGQEYVYSTLIAGGLSVGVLITFWVLMGVQSKENLIRINIKDYLENFLKARLESNSFDLELLEQYKKEVIELSAKQPKKEKKKESEQEAILVAQTESAATEQMKDKATLRREAKKKELKAMIQADKEKRPQDQESDQREEVDRDEMSDGIELEEKQRKKFSKPSPDKVEDKEEMIELGQDVYKASPSAMRKAERQVKKEPIEKEPEKKIQSRYDISKEEVKIIEDILNEYLA